MAGCREGVRHAPGGVSIAVLRSARTALILFTVLPVALALTFALRTSDSHADPAIDSFEADFLDLINEYRVNNQAQPLGLNLQLNAAADWFACDMARDSYFGHFDNESPSRSPGGRAAYFGYSGGVGENIAGGFATALDVFVAWQNSPGHNSNMLKAQYKVIGIARYYDPGSTFRYYWVTDFGFGPSPGNPPTAASDCPGGVPATTPPNPTVTPPTSSPGVTVTPTPVPTLGGTGAAAVFLSQLVCNGNPEYVRIKNYSDEPVSLSGFSFRSDPVDAQNFDLSEIVPVIGADQTIELRSGSNAEADPENGVYVLTTEHLYRDNDASDFAYLVRPVNSNVLMYCPKPATPTPTPTPVPSDVTPTITPEPSPTGEDVFTWADLDCSDVLNSNDSMVVLAAAAGVVSPSGGSCPQVGTNVTVGDHVWRWGDINCSGAVNAKDAVDLLVYLGAFGVQISDPECPAPGTLF